MKENAAIKRGCFYCILAGAAWGFAGVCGQFLFDGRLWSVDFIIPLRILMAGLVLVPLALRTEGTAGYRRLFQTRRNTRDLLIFGILGIGLCQYSYYTTIRLSNATTATVLCYLGPVLIILWQVLRSRRPPEKKELLAVCLAAAGTFFLATHGDPGSLVLSRGALIWGMIAALATAVYSVQPRRLTGECGILSATSLGMIAAGIFLCLVRQPWNHVEGVFDLSAWLCFFVIVLVGSALCFWLYFMGVALIGPAKASILGATELLVSALLSVFWLRVAFLPMDYVGFILVVSTIFVLALPSSGRADAEKTEQT